MRSRDAFDFDGDYGRIYDHIARTVIPGYEQLFPATLAVLRQRVGERARVLVVGCGTGQEVAAFAPREPGWTVTAVDPSPVMIEATRQVARDLSVLDRVTLVQGLVSDLDDTGFDAATVINVMHFLADDGAKAGLMRDVAMRVRPGGSVVLFDLHGDPASESFRLLDGAWARYMELRGLVGEDKARFRKRLQDGIVYVPESRVLEICREAGLELTARYFGGLLYGGWLLTRTRSAP